MANFVDVEDETILTAVFRDSFPAREPERLADERAQVLQQTQELAFDNYKTFIETADCSREIVEDFTDVEQHLNNLLDKLPDFGERCNQFLKEAQQISTSRRMNSLTLSKHTQLLEILEIPQLMDTCVRNGYYDEALELAAYVKRLEKKHSGIPVIKDIVTEVHSSSQLMLNQLIQQLRSAIQLPACLRLIGYLRRMDLFTEAELRIKFLQARDAWFQGILAAIQTDDAYTHITKVIEASRVHLFDIVTQYRAIFSDDDPILATSHDSVTNEAALFQGWVVQKVSQFLHTLEQDLERGIGNRLDSLLGQCMYFGLSFSRVGADFRGLLAPIFQRAALHSFLAMIKSATEKFEGAMQSYTPVASQAFLAMSSVSLPSIQGDSVTSPPQSLMEHPPLATYTNSVLAGFNDLRLCAPVAVAQHVSDALQQSLQKVVHSIVAFHRAEESTFNQRERDQFQSLCECASAQMVPFLNRCLLALFPPAIITQTLGISLTELQKLGQVGSLDVSSITSPLQPLLPEKEQPAVPEDIEEEEEEQVAGEDGRKGGKEEGKKEAELTDSKTTETERRVEQAETQPVPHDAGTASTDAVASQVRKPDEPAEPVRDIHQERTETSAEILRQKKD
ncbi:conserved oligomeric Golgi complex subunit 8-like [Diadema antillarum]|uniref:conserved oligomeric Golgi complex subunit 8-like n=1 Tax=Diadema antillarum TaxID=105358 RepID=UPI003A877244